MALVEKCNFSLLEWTVQAINAQEASIRSHALDFITKVLLIETNSNLKCTNTDNDNVEVIYIPDEVFFIKEVIDSTRDCHNNIKFKAAQAIHQILEKGSKIAQKIVSESLRFATFCDVEDNLLTEPYKSENEIRYTKPQPVEPAYTFQGWEKLEDTIKNFPEYIYEYLYCNNLAYIRRAGIILIQTIAKLNPLVIYNTPFVQVCEYFIAFYLVVKSLTNIFTYI